MGMKERTVGGGSATGLADDFTAWLQGALNTGSFGGQQPAGSGAIGSTLGISGVLNNLLSPGGGAMGNSLMEMISKDTERQASALRARYGQQGLGYGTPAAYSEALLRSEQAPKLTQAIGGLQLQALFPIIQAIAGISQLGIPQRQTVMQPNNWVQGIGVGSDLIGSIAKIISASQGA